MNRGRSEQTTRLTDDSPLWFLHALAKDALQELKFYRAHCIAYREGESVLEFFLTLDQVALQLLTASSCADPSTRRILLCHPWTGYCRSCTASGLLSATLRFLVGWLGWGRYYARDSEDVAWRILSS